MTTQLLIYETAVPVSSGRHGKCSIEAGRGYAFARRINSVPLMAVEFPQAAPDYAIVFAQTGDDVMPVVILGARLGENLYLAEHGNRLSRRLQTLRGPHAPRRNAPPPRPPPLPSPAGTCRCRKAGYDAPQTWRRQRASSPQAGPSRPSRRPGN